MALALDCPHCATGKVETVRSAWFLQGFLLFARWGSRSWVGCDSCTRSKVLGSLALSSMLGWWCFPWGLGTPVVILQNAAALAGGSDRQALSRLLMDQGVDIDDLELDEQGLSPGQRKLREGVISVLHSMIWADGDADPREIDTGVDIGTKMLGELMSADQIRAVLSDVEPPAPLAPEGMPRDARLILMKAASAIAAADEVIEESEREELRALGARLELPAEVAEYLIEGLDGKAAEDEGVRAIAAEVLGIGAETAMAEVHEAYQARKLEANEIEEPEERNERNAQLTWAYEVMVGARSAA